MKLEDLCPVSIPQGFDLPEEVFIGEGLAAALGEVLRRYPGGRVLLVSDPDCLAAARGLLEALPATDRPALRVLLPPRPHADDAAVERVLAAAGGATGLLAVGSGTVNDVAKMAAARRRIPYVVAGTAASMNGYASGVAAILGRGLKMTLAASPPRAIVLDTAILRQAPPAMARAGLGDLLSRPVSMADWWLAHRLEGSSYSDLPGRLVDDAIRGAVGQAANLAAGTREAHEALARALVLSGVSMVVAGSSSPASGGEHLLSHLWDMEAIAAGREIRLHGAQVGIATIVSAALYERILSLESPSFAGPPSPGDLEARIRRDHGALAGTVLEPARRKLAGAAARIDTLRRFWPELRRELEGLGIPSPGEIRRPLVEAGAPHTLAALGLSAADGLRALRVARDIRDRVTVLDLAFELGIFPAALEEVLERSGV